MSCDIGTSSTFVDSSVTLMDRITGVDAANITQASVDTIAYVIRKNGAEVASDSLTKTDVVFDTLSTGNGWTEDTTGWNFKWVVPGSNFASEGTYYIEITITDTNGFVSKVMWVVNVEANGH